MAYTSSIDLILNTKILLLFYKLLLGLAKVFRLLGTARCFYRLGYL
jgi:hypothetical protein